MGGTWAGKLDNDVNWVDGCFEWYQNKGGQNENTKKFYFNQKSSNPDTGDLGGNRVCSIISAANKPDMCAVFKDRMAEVKACSKVNAGAVVPGVPSGLGTRAACECGWFRPEFARAEQRDGQQATLC